MPLSTLFKPNRPAEKKKGLKPNGTEDKKKTNKKQNIIMRTWFSKRSVMKAVI